MALSPQVKVSFKIITIMILILILWGLSATVYFTINERQQRLSQVEREISSSWGEAQYFGDLGLRVYNSVDETVWHAGKSSTSSRILDQILPVHGLKVDIVDTVQIKERNMFSTPVYEMTLTASGYIDSDEISEEDIDLFKSAEHLDIVLSVGDIHGLSDYEIRIADTLVTSKPTITEEGYSTEYGYFNRDTLKFKLSQLKTREGKIAISYTLHMKGTKSMFIGGITTNAEVTMTSNWPHPSFQGRILPETSEIREDGFSATWKTPALSDSGSFGVEHMLAMEIYQKIERSIKYAILFIIATFFAFFIVEILQRQKVHPIQYTLIGISMLIFYLLLLSFAEHVGFLYAYIIAALATIGLISFYSFSILKNRHASIFITGLLMFLYVFLYIIINLEDNALLVGSVFCFLIISSIMIATRKIDWYNISQD